MLHMKKLVIFLVLFLLSVNTLAIGERASLFQEQLQTLHSPVETMLKNKKASLHPGDKMYLPFIENDIIPTDLLEEYQAHMVGTSISSNPEVLEITETGLMVAKQSGQSEISYTSNGVTQTLTVVVSSENLPIQIQNLIYIANYEYLSNAMQRLPRYNKYAKWYYKTHKEVGWCSVFTSYLNNAAGLATFKHNNINLTPLEGAKVFGLLEGQVGNQYVGFQSVNRFVQVPKPGYNVIYGNRKNAYKHTHIGLVVESIDLGNGRYRIRTIEGNMSNTVKSYVFEYDSTVAHPKENMYEVDEAFRTNPLYQYTLHTDYWSVFGFCATWE